MRREQGTGAVDEQSIGGLGRSRDDAMKGGRNLLQKGIRHSWRADQLRSRRIDVKISQGTCGCHRRGEKNVKAFKRGNDLGLCFVKTHRQNACNAGLNRHYSPDSACLLPTDRCAACKSDRNSITCACNRRKNSRIQAPMLDPYVRPFEGTVKLASLITAIVNEKSHACGPIGSGQLPCITSYYFNNPTRHRRSVGETARYGQKGPLHCVSEINHAPEKTVSAMRPI